MSELNRLSANEYKEAEKHPFALVLDNVRSTLNVGSVFRSADAFRCEEIILVGVTPAPTKEMNKTALGATEAVAWLHFDTVEETTQYLRKKNYELWALEQVEGSEKLLEWSISKKSRVAFVLGNEVSGVSNQFLDHCTGCIEIPQYGTKHSLNVSVSSGIVMWEFIKQLKG